MKGGTEAEEGLGGSARPLSPSALVGFTACVHRTELERAAAVKLIEKPHYPNATLDALVQRGREHEGAHLDELRARGLDVVEIPSAEVVTPAALADAARLTIEAMQGGASIIYQATFIQTQGGFTWRAHPDFLHRVAQPSTLGSWSYEPWDAKLARVAKAKALLQLCAYAEMVARIQDRPPDDVHLILGGPGRPSASYRHASIAPYYRQVRNQFIAHMAAGRPATFPVNDPYPDPVEHCAVCDWSPICDDRWRLDDHISLVAGVTRNQRKALLGRGVITLEALSVLPLPVVPALERTSSVSVAKVREQARVQREGREKGTPVWEPILNAGTSAGDTATASDERSPVERGMGLAALPTPSPADLFFDIEGDPFVGDAGHEYLFGVASVDGRYDAFWSFDATREKEMFERVVDLFHERLQRSPDLHIYHFAPYETGALKRLAGRLGTRVEEVDNLLRREVFVDLHRVVRQGIRASVESYSIKKLEPFYGFVRDMNLRVAGDARAALELWLEGGRGERLPDHDEICRKVEAYNREDCVSALRLRDWLEICRRDVETRIGADIPRPVHHTKEPSEESTELKARIAAAKDALAHDIPVDLAERSTEQQGRWLLAQLTEWHAREDKSTWWDFFRMRDLSDQEVVEDPKALGGITYEGEIGPIKRSTIHRYRYAPQEHDLESGDECELRAPGYRTGDIEAGASATRKLVLHHLDDLNCTFDITIGKNRRPPDIGALIPKLIVPTKHHRARLLEIAESAAVSGLAGPGQHTLARDLILRIAPGDHRIASDVAAAAQVPAPLVREGEDVQDAAVRLVLDLARAPRGGVLPVQGPPGSGKTHTGAEMVLALVNAKFKVGVSGPSHKVIATLLAKVCELARKHGRTLSIGQKPGKDEAPMQDPFVIGLENANAAVGALQAGTIQIVAGTSWLWVEPAMASAVDVLLVDEAGQISLANAVAMAHATRAFALLGDPQQLDQPRKGVHPEGAEVSVLEHLSPGTYTMAPHRGVFLNHTRRLHADLCRFTSDMFYDRRLTSTVPEGAHTLAADPSIGGSGLRWWPVTHDGNQNESPEEVAAVKELFDRLLDGKARWTDERGEPRDLGIDDIVVVAPYNAQVRALIAALPAGAKVGTVDKFQGQEAAVAIYSMTSSSPEDAPRGMEFLYSLNRLNVATSRAKSLAIVVASPALLRPACKTPRQMMQAAGLCAAAEAGIQ